MCVSFLGKIQCSLLNVNVESYAVIASCDCHGTEDTAASGPQNYGKITYAAGYSVSKSRLEPANLRNVSEASQLDTRWIYHHLVRNRRVPILASVQCILCVQ
jgi:hypothetical protein